MITKYGNEVSFETLQQSKKRLINQMWKLIPLKEEEKDWESHLDNLILEISGLYMILPLELLIILAKLEGLKLNKDISFLIYRNTVFRTITLLEEAFPTYG